MKRMVKNLLPALYLMVIAFSAASCNKTQAAPAAASAPAGQPVDLTYAAEKSLPSVVYIKSVQNAKTQTVEYNDPFEDFFSDPFGGFFGRGQGNNNGTRKRQVQTPKRAAAGSGVIISADGYIVTNNHVVQGATKIEVTLNNNMTYEASLVGTDPAANYVQIAPSTQYAEGKFTAEDYAALVAKMFSGEITVSNAIDALPATTIKVNDLGTVK